MWICGVLCYLAFLPALSIQAGDDSDITVESPTIDSKIAESGRIGSEFKGSPDVDAALFFYEPPIGQQSGLVILPAGKQALVSVLFTNKAKQDVATAPSFVLYSMEGALHYPHNYGYHIQNFTHMRMQNTIEPGQEATALYTVWPHSDLIGQSVDLCIVANYHDRQGNVFRHSLFNRTISLIEQEEPMDTDAIFRIIFQICVVALLGIGGYTWFFSKSSSEYAGSCSIFVKSTNDSGAKSNKNATAFADLDATGQVTEKRTNEYAALLNKKDKTTHKRNQGRN